MTDGESEAQTLYKSALKIYELQVGEDHEITRNVRNALESISLQSQSVQEQSLIEDSQ